MISNEIQNVDYSALLRESNSARERMLEFGMRLNQLIHFAKIEPRNLVYLDDMNIQLGVKSIRVGGGSRSTRIEALRMTRIGAPAVGIPHGYVGSIALYRPKNTPIFMKDQTGLYYESGQENQQGYSVHAGREAFRLIAPKFKTPSFQEAADIAALCALKLS